MKKNHHGPQWTFGLLLGALGPLVGTSMRKEWDRRERKNRSLHQQNDDMGRRALTAYTQIDSINCQRESD